jgi:hypothetical protein
MGRAKSRKAARCLSYEDVKLSEVKPKITFQAFRDTYHLERAVSWFSNRSDQRTGYWRPVLVFKRKKISERDLGYLTVSFNSNYYRWKSSGWNWRYESQPRADGNYLAQYFGKHLEL